MEVSFKPQPLVGEVLPGFTTLCILGTAYLVNHPAQLDWFVHQKSAAEVITAGFATILVSWIIGTLFDTIRDLLEHLIDQRFPVNWDFLFKGEAGEIEKLNESWLAYYFLAGNSAIGLIISVICGNLIGPVHIPAVWLIFILGVGILFGANSVLLRNEIRRMIGYQSGRMPHDGVYARLKPADNGMSVIQDSEKGVGIFAIRNIPKGALVFAPDDDNTVLVRQEDIEMIPEELKRLYHDFCVLEGDMYLCPVNFNKLTLAWYANNSENPNIAPDKSLRFRAIRDIAAGEELISRYADYSENEKTVPS